MRNPLVIIKHSLELAYFKLRPARYFKIEGKSYPYFYHFYNATWTAERKVEIPVFREIVLHEKGRILEVGNVLSHYMKTRHVVVDKYEKAVGVVNQDIVDFKPKEQYDLIISISTLEHVGLDEEDKDVSKPRKAIVHLLGLLRKGGKLVFSFPVGYNPNLDAALQQFKISKKTVVPIRSEGLTRRLPKKLCIVEIKG